MPMLKQTSPRVLIPKRPEPYTMELPIEQIVPWEGNPTARTAEKAVASLVEAIRASGVVSEIHAVNNGDDTVTAADGHRRRYACIQLGIRTMMVRVYPDTYKPGDLYVMLGTGVRTQNGADSLEAYILGDVLPKNARLAQNIKFCVRLCGGKKETKRVMLDGPRRIPPNIAMTTMSAAAFLNGGSVRSGRGGMTQITDTHRKVFAWIIEHGDQRLRRLLATPMLSDSKKLVMLRKAINGNTDLAI